jgi:hypothetical protein
MHARPCMQAECAPFPGPILPQDFADLGPGRQTKPMERAEKEFDIKKMIDDSKDWKAVQLLLTESPHKQVEMSACMAHASRSHPTSTAALTIETLPPAGLRWTRSSLPTPWCAAPA